MDKPQEFLYIDTNGNADHMQRYIWTISYKAAIVGYKKCNKSQLCSQLLSITYSIYFSFTQSSRNKEIQTSKF